MAMTAAVKDELAPLVVTKARSRKAEVSSILRAAGGLTASSSAQSARMRLLPEAVLGEPAANVGLGSDPSGMYSLRFRTLVCAS